MLKMGRFCLSFSTFSFFGAGFVGQQAKAKGNVNAHAHRRTVGPRSTVEHGAQRSAHVGTRCSLSDVRHSLFSLAFVSINVAACWGCTRTVSTHTMSGHRHSRNRSVETRVHFSRELHRALNLDSGKVQPLTALSHRSRISAYPFAVTSKPLRLKPTRIMSRASLCTSLHSVC